MVNSAAKKQRGVEKLKSDLSVIRKEIQSLNKGVPVPDTIDDEYVASKQVELDEALLQKQNANNI